MLLAVEAVGALTLFSILQYIYCILNGFDLVCPQLNVVKMICLQGQEICDQCSRVLLKGRWVNPVKVVTTNITHHEEFKRVHSLPRSIYCVLHSQWHLPRCQAVASVDVALAPRVKSNDKDG